MTGRADFEKRVALSPESVGLEPASTTPAAADGQILPCAKESETAWRPSPSAASIAMARVLARKKRAIPPVIPWRAGATEPENRILLQDTNPVERRPNRYPGSRAEPGGGVYDPYDSSSLESFDLQQLELITGENPERVDPADPTGEEILLRLTLPAKPVAAGRSALHPAPAREMAAAATVGTAPPPAESVRPPTVTPEPPALPEVATAAESRQDRVEQEREAVTKAELALLAVIQESAQVARESARMVRDSAALAAESAQALQQAAQRPTTAKAVVPVALPAPLPTVPPAVARSERVIVPVEKLFSGLSSAWGDVLDSVASRRPVRRGKKNFLHDY